MTYFDQTALRAPRSGMFTRLLGRLHDWNDTRLTRKALSALTDRELDDISLTRSDVDALGR